MTTAMIDDLVKLEAPEGTFSIDIHFHMTSEEDVHREAERRGKRPYYLPDEASRKHVLFNDNDSGVAKTFIAQADPR